jgi:hypothetical protein
MLSPVSVNFTSQLCFLSFHVMRFTIPPTLICGFYSLLMYYVFLPCFSSDVGRHVASYQTPDPSLTTVAHVILQ